MPLELHNIYHSATSLPNKIAVNKFFLGILLLTWQSMLLPAMSHSGGTDSSGCHTNSQTGSYHCHSSGSSSRRSSYSPSRRSSYSPSRRSSSDSIKIPITSDLSSFIKGCPNLDKLDVHSYPSKDSTIIYQLNQNDCIFVKTRPFLGSEDSIEWVQIILSDGRYGYVASKHLNI